jgi:hypothetical protein
MKEHLIELLGKKQMNYDELYEKIQYKTKTGEKPLKKCLVATVNLNKNTFRKLKTTPILIEVIRNE